MKIGNIEIKFRHKKYRRNWMLKYVPMFSSFDIADALDRTIARGYDLAWLNILVYITWNYKMPQDDHQIMHSFPSSNFIDWIISLHKTS